MAASSNKLGFVTLLLLLCVVGSSVVKQANSQTKPCPRNCDGRAEYMLCPSQDLKAKQIAGQLCTNCCAAENMGCILFDENWSPYCQEEEESSFRKIRTMV